MKEMKKKSENKRYYKTDFALNDSSISLLSCMYSHNITWQKYPNTSSGNFNVDNHQKHHYYVLVLYHTLNNFDPIKYVHCI